jgi:hypothetical protein
MLSLFVVWKWKWKKGKNETCRLRLKQVKLDVLAVSQDTRETCRSKQRLKEVNIFNLMEKCIALGRNK